MAGTQNINLAELAAGILKPFSLTLTEIRNQRLEDYEMDLIVRQNRREYSEAFINLLMDRVHRGEVR
jgi:galactose-1-phosphate uridylyltransferase